MTKIPFKSWEKPLADQRAAVLMENAVRAGRALIRNGSVPFLFMYGLNGFERQALTRDDLYAEFQHTTKWFSPRDEEENGDGTSGIKFTAKDIPYTIMRTAYSKIVIENTLYNVRNIVTYPIVNKNGEFVLRNGLKWKEKTVNRRLVKTPELDIEDAYDDVSQSIFIIEDRARARLEGVWKLGPSVEQVRQALAILDDFFIDYGFADKSSRQSALAFMLTMICRDVIGESVPMLEVLASRSQSGKTRLVKMILTGITGLAHPSMFSPRFEDVREFEQELFSELLKGLNYIFMDNVRGVMRSGLLETGLTTGFVNKRLLGVSNSVTVYSGMPFVFTANKPKLSEDIRNRIYLLEIEKPPANKRYIHENTQAYALEKHPDVLWALFIVYRNWDKNYKREEFRTRRIEGYPEWSRVIGGQLAAVGMGDDFLTGTLKQIQTPDEWEIRAHNLAEKIYQTIGEKPFRASDLGRLDSGGGDMYEGAPVLGPFCLEAGYVKEMGDEKQKSREQRMAEVLKKLDKVPLDGGYCFARDEKERYGSVWRVVRNAQGS